jgi:Na+/melibiose symporter-like transporter
MNVPICAVALGVILLFMRVKTGARDPNHSKLQQVDWLGNAIFISSMISLLLGLVMGGIQHPWSSWRIILPIILGAIGWAVFHIQQALPSTKWPSVPPRLFKNRTSATAFILTFMASVLVNSAAYFLPVWFQAVLSNSVLQAGINFLPLAISTLFFAVIGGILLTKFGAYRPLHALSFALTAIGFGLLTILSPEKARWATFQLIMGAGMGIHVSTMLPAIMASLSEADVAASAAVYCFIRTFGYIWGVTMPSIIFNAMVNRNLYHVSDDWLREQLRDGGAYSFASQLHELRPGLTDESFRELVAVYTKSLNVIWWVSMGISIASLCGVAGEEGLELRSELETEYGIEERKEAAE